MASTAYRGAWQLSSYRGAWQQQAQAYQATLSDGISLADQVAVGAGIPLADGITLADLVTVGTAATLADAIALSDALASKAGAQLADSISPSDSLSVAAAKQLADGIGMMDESLENVGHIDDGVPGHLGHAVCGHGTFIFFANYHDGIRAYTFDGSTFTNVGHYNSGTRSVCIASDGTHIFVGCNTDGLKAFSFDGSTFTHLKTEALGSWVRDLFWDGTYLYVANYTNGLYAYTFDGSSFTQVANIYDAGSYRGVWGDGNFIYCGTYTDGIRAYTFNGVAFTNVGHRDDGSLGYGVWGDGTRVYLACFVSGGVRAYTFDGSTFTLVGRDDECDEALSVWGDGERIYVADYSGGIYVYLFDGANFVKVANRNDGGYGYDVWGDGTDVFLANREDGLRAYRFVPNLVLAAGSLLADSVTPSDALAAAASVPISDGVTLADALIQGYAETFAESVALSDAVVAKASKLLDDQIGLADSVSGSVQPGINTGVGVESGATIHAGSKQPRTGRKTVTNTPTPITSVNSSSLNTTFTATGIQDSSAWDLSEVEVNDIAVAEGGYAGRVTGTGVNSVTIAGWVLGGIDLRGMAAAKPAAGSRVTIYKTIRAKALNVAVNTANDNTVYIGWRRDLDCDNGHPLPPRPGQPNASVTVEAPRDRFLNLTQLWIVSGSTQHVNWTTESEPGAGGSAGSAQSRTLEDQISLSDSSTQDAAVVLSDAIVLTDALRVVGIDVSPTRLDFWHNLTNLDITITNTGNVTLDWSITNVPAYLSPSVASGSLGPAANVVVTITADRSGLLEGMRYWNHFDVNDIGAGETVHVETHVMTLNTIDCAFVAAATELSISPTPPVDRNNPGTAIWTCLGSPPAAKFGCLRQERGPWDVTIVGVDTEWPPVGGPVVTGTVKALVLDNKEWVPFVSGTPSVLDEQADFELRWRSGYGGSWVSEGNFGRGNIRGWQFAQRNGVWEKCYDGFVSCTGTANAVRVQPVAVVQASHSAAPYFHDTGAVGTPVELQTDPYRDEDGHAILKGDMWIPSDDITVQTPAPRTYLAPGTGLPPLYHYEEPTGPPPPDWAARHATWLEAVASITDEWWANIPGATFTDGSVSVTVDGGNSYDVAAFKSDGDPLSFFFSQIFKSNLVGGGYDINISGGDEDQVIDLFLSQNPGVKWFRAGLLQTYGALRPYGFFIYTWVGYTENVFGSVPGADYHSNFDYFGDVRFYWGSGVTGPAGTSGFRPSGSTNQVKICLKKTGGSWVVQYVSGAGAFLNVAKTAVVNIVY